MQVSSSRRTEPPSATTSTGRVPSRLAIGSEAVDRQEVRPAGRKRANCSAVVPIPMKTVWASPSSSRRAHPDQALLAGVLERAGVEGDVERAGQVGGRPAVRLAQEAVALEPADVAPDRHLGHAELAGQLADVDGLLVGDPLEDRDGVGRRRAEAGLRGARTG